MESTSTSKLGVSKLSVKGQIVSMFGFVGFAVSVLTIQPCWGSVKVTVDNA